MKKIFISTAIPYVNANPHVGHAFEFVQADALARYHRLIGNKVFFCTGSDDNSLKNVLKAEDVNETTASFVKRHSDIFVELCRQLEISYDYFVSTAFDINHKNGAQKLWQKSYENNYIYKKKYSGQYCVGCEEFKIERDLNDNAECPEQIGRASCRERV